jgi:hypothetical protein
VIRSHRRGFELTGTGSPVAVARCPLITARSAVIEGYIRLYSAISSPRSSLTKSFHDIVRLSWSTSVTPITYCGC